MGRIRKAGEEQPKRFGKKAQLGKARTKAEIKANHKDQSQRRNTPDPLVHLMQNIQFDTPLE
jgi:hypothetical protein